MLLWCLREIKVQPTYPPIFSLRELLQQNYMFYKAAQWMSRRGERGELQETPFCQKAWPTTETKEIRCSNSNSISLPYTF